MLQNIQSLSKLEALIMDGHLDLMAKNFAKAIKIFSNINPQRLTPELQATYYADLGEAYLHLDKLAEARETLETGLKLYYTQYALPILGRERIRNMIGITYYKENKYIIAQEIFLKCLDAINKRSVDDRLFKVNIYRNLANCNMALKLFDAALDSYQLALLNTLDDEEEESRAGLYWGIADIYYQHFKNYKDGVAYYYRSASLYRRAGNLTMAANVQSSLGSILLERDQVDEAVEVLKTALEEAWKAPENLIPVIYASMHLGKAYSLKGNFELAEQYGQRAVEFAKQQESVLIKGQTLMLLAESMVLKKDINQGLSLYEEAGHYLCQTSHKTILKKYFKEYSDTLQSQGQGQKALELLIKAVQI